MNPAAGGHYPVVNIDDTATVRLDPSAPRPLETEGAEHVYAFVSTAPYSVRVRTPDRQYDT